MKAQPLPPLEYLQQCFELSSGSPTGLIWKNRPLAHFQTRRAGLRVNSMYAGKPAGCHAVQRKRKTDYWRVAFDGRFIFVHRIVYALSVNSTDIPADIDHVDGNGLNNAINNLRQSTHGQNQMNRGTSRSNTSGFKGVRKEGNGYRARIRKNGKLVHLGRFVSPELAYAAYCAAGKEHQKEFFRKA